jgi:hypothetical protein
MSNGGWLWLLLCGLVLLLLGLILTPIKVEFFFHGDWSTAYVRYRYLFYQKYLLPVPEKKEEKKARKKAKKRGAPTPSPKDKPGSVTSLLKDYGVVETVRMMAQSASSLLQAIFHLLKKGKLKHFKGVFAIGGEDAADAALNYGQVCAVLYPVLGLASSYLTLIHPDLQLYCDYNRTDSDIRVSGVIHISVLRLPVAVLRAFQYLVNKNLQKRR